MRPTLYTVDHPGPGLLSTMAKPRGGDWLEDEMAALKAYGVDVLVCALTSAELEETGLETEAQAAHEAGLHFVPVPIPDRDVPDLAAALPILQQLSAQLRGGKHVVTHCRFGIGRASLLAAALMVLNGVHPDTAWHRLQQARGLAVPDTAAQRQCVSKLPRETPS
jgi:protein-tyrosine phosphatase